MITKLEARNNRGGLLSLELDDVTDGIILADVQGLDPVKATIVATSYAGQDGAQFQTAYLEPRDLIIVLDLEPDDAGLTMRDIRARLYNYFMPKSQVSLRLYDDSDLTVDISGVVESMPAPLFVKEPQVRATIRCMEPAFVNVESSTLEAETTDDSDEEHIAYDGTVDTGFVFELDVDRDLTEFTIYHRTPSGSINQMDVAIELHADDVLTISTVEGNLTAILRRAFTDSSVIYAVSKQAVWHKLENGDNYIRVLAEGDPIPYEITYTSQYGGL